MSAISLELIKQQINMLYKTNPKVHLNVSLKKPKITFENIDATITGVYPHIFQIEEYTNGYAKKHTLQYADVVTDAIVILELEKGN